MDQRFVLFFQLLFDGMRDSIFGCVRIYQLDRAVVFQKSVPESSDRQNTSVLSRRRLKQPVTKPKEKDSHFSNQKVLNRVLLCCAWNGGVFWLSIFAFYNLLLPLLHMITELYVSLYDTSQIWQYIYPPLSWTFNALWVLPLFILSKVINSLWFLDIADLAYKKSGKKVTSFSRLGLFIADNIFSIFLQSLFLIQGTLTGFLSIKAIGQFICLFHMCLLYSFYSFEYKWYNMGWSITRRIDYIETNWPYFLGFGLPLALLTSYPSSNIISGCVFSIVFPLFIISGNEAKPVKTNFTQPIRIFSPAVFITNLILEQTFQLTRSA